MAVILLYGIAVFGCATPFRSSGIDPSGERVFLDPAYAQGGLVQVCPPLPICPPLPVCPPGQPIATLQPYRPPASSIPRQAVGGLPMATGSQLAAGQSASGGPLLGAMSGGYREYPGRMLPWDNTQVIVTPCRTIAPVGSEVVLLAGVRGQDQYLRTNERVEWTIAPGGVGTFLDYSKGLWRDLLLGDWTWPRKISPTMAVTSTSRQYLRLSRETPTPDDDINVLRGQTWVTVTAASEGISRVRAFAPSVYGWHARKQTAVIHWIDAQWKLPTPAFAVAGARQVLTTVVTRHTDGGACAGWKVVYEVLGGGSAGFAPGGTSRTTVITDECGRATVELAQTQAVSETTQINIRVIRPARIEGDAGKELNVGGGGTTVTWTSPELTVRKTGPTMVAVGQAVVYRIDISNSGDLATEGVVLTDEIPAGLQYDSSTPPAELAGANLRWNLGTLAPRASSTIEVRLVATRPGSVTSCAEATSSGALKARDCVTTTVGEAALEVQMLGPPQVYVGDEVDFKVVVANRGQVTASGLSITDRFDPGLEHAVAKSPIERELPSIEPGNSRNIGLIFRATRVGRLCHNVEITAAGRTLATGRKCVNVIARPTPPAGVAPTSPPASVEVTRKCPAVAKVGEVVMCEIVVSNNGTVPLTGIKVVENFNANLYPTRATDGHKFGTNRLSWTLPSIQPGKAERLLVYYRCEAAMAKTCCTVDVRSSQGASDRAESCLQILANLTRPVTPWTGTPGVLPGGRLTVTVSDNYDPVTHPKRVTYEIVVKNESATPDRDIVVTAIVPPEMSPRSTGNVGPGNNLDAKINGQEIRFAEIAEIRPEESLTYHVTVDTKNVGTAILRVKVTSNNSPRAVMGREETTIQGR